METRTFKMNLAAVAAIAIAMASPGAIELAFANGQGLGLPGLRADGTTLTTYYVNSELPRVDPNTNALQVDPVTQRTIGIKKFEDPLSNLDTDGTGTLGQGLPVAIPNVSFPNGTLTATASANFTDLLSTTALKNATPYPGSDYYELGIVDFREQLSSSLPTTLHDGNGTAISGGTHVRGYVQLVPCNWSGHDLAGVARTATPLYHIDATPVLDANKVQLCGATKPHYLGPVMLAFKGTPVRVLYRNLLPTDRAIPGDPTSELVGNARIPFPVDETYTGAGFGPDGRHKFEQNRAEIHLHGGVTPWVSDGTPHQWTVPVNSDAYYKTGPSFVNVPDMPDPGPGSGTLYWTNDQSARLMMFHDHVSGITRINAYVGEAAGLVLLDKLGTGEHTLPIPGTSLNSLEQIPLVIQDKSFVPSDIDAQDPKWNYDVNGTRVDPLVSGRGVQGDLWFPHVYETNQDPSSPDGTNPVGRWDWAPYFWPVFPSQYALPSGAVGDETGTPEAFMDTPVVNGTVYPYLNVLPQAYRFRVLSIGNDRALNLGFYQAEPLSVGLASSGTGYTSAPAVSFAGGLPSGNNTLAAATAVIGVTAIPLPSPNASVFTVPPTITISAPPAGSGNVTATAVATLKALGANSASTTTTLNSIQLSNPGNGYTSAPTVTITPDPADRNAFIAAYGTATKTVTASFGLAGITITNDGTNGGLSPWTSAPTVHLTGGGGTGAVAVAAVNSEVHMVSFDSSYVPPLAASITPNGHPFFPSSGGLMGTGWGFPDARAGGVPDPAFAGPDIVQIGNEGGLLPKSVAIPSTPINYEYNKRSVTVLNALEHGLFLMPGERADIVVDFAKYAGKTLILYNDSAAPLPAGDPRIDYYTGDTDFTGSGGAPTTLPGYGPNTRTVMQFRVAAATAGQHFGPALVSGSTSMPYPSVAIPSSTLKAWDSTTLDDKLASAYAATQPAPVVAETAYAAAAAYGTTANGWNKTTSPVAVPFGADQYLPISAGSLQMPVFDFTPGNSAASTGGINSVKLISGGGGYLRSPTVVFTGGGATGANVAKATSALKISGITLTSPGSGYIAAPTVTIASTGTGAGATAQAYLMVGTVQITNAGSYADGTYNLTFSQSAPGGTAASGTATLTTVGAAKTWTYAISPGSGYNVAPTCAIDTDPVSGTTGTCALSAVVEQIVITAPNPLDPTTAGGIGYTDLSTVTATLSAPPAGTTAGVANTTATANITAGSVQAVTVTFPGRGYTGTPTVSFRPSPTNGPGSGAAAQARQTGTMSIRSVAIQELFEPIYGRMNATLGVELPATTAITQTTIPLAYVDPTTESIEGGQTQIWKITHNGVDSHPVHFHLVNVQVINRVGWDGTVKPPHDNEVGWKETVRMNPLEDVYVAVQAKQPVLLGVLTHTGTGNQFGLPESWRLEDPSQQAGSTLGFTQIDPLTGAPATVFNSYENYDWEYVWHCHILGHEENDFMRPFVLNAITSAGVAPTNVTAANLNGQTTLGWTDNSSNEYQFVIRRLGRPAGATVPTNTQFNSGSTIVGTALANATSFVDSNAPIVGTNGATIGTYYYKVCAVSSNAFTNQYTAPSVASTCNTTAVSATAQALIPPTAPSVVTFSNINETFLTVQWTDNSNNEVGFLVEQCDGDATACAQGGATWATLNAQTISGQTVSVAANVKSVGATGLVKASPYTYRVSAINAAGQASGYAVGSTTTATDAVASAPTNLTATPTDTMVALSWLHTGPETAVTVTVSPATGSVVAGGITYALSGGVATLPVGTTSALVTGLANNTSYTLTVTVVSGASSAGASVPATTLYSAAVAPSNLSAGTPTTSQVNLTWTNTLPQTGITINVPAGATLAAAGITSVSGGVSGATATLLAGTTAATVTNLSPGTGYTFTVTSLNGPVNSAAASVTTATLYAAATAPTVTLVSPTDTTVALTWSNTLPQTGITLSVPLGAGVSVSNVAQTVTNGLVTLAAGTTSATINTLNPGVAYTFTLTSLNGPLNSAAAAPINATTLFSAAGSFSAGPTATPTAGTGTTAITLSWTVTGAQTGVLVTVPVGASLATTSGGTPVTLVNGLAVLPAGTSQVFLTGLAPATTYSFTVTSLSGANATTATVSGTTDSLPAAALSGSVLATAVTPTIVNLSWTAPTIPAGYAVTGYLIKRDGTTIPNSLVPGATSFRDTTATRHTSYTAYTVQTVSGLVNVSATISSNPVTTPDVLVRTDLNGDGKSDLVWHNSSAGQDRIWLMDGATNTSSADYGPYAGWTLVSANQDFNGDGKSDLFWQNSSGEQSIWLMNGTTQIGVANFGPYANWTVVSANEDFNGDGKSDLLWQNSSGEYSIWLMDGTTQIGVANFGPYAGWTLVSGNQDFNGDGKSDLLWQNSSGEYSIWLMDGTTQIGVANFGPYANWTVVSANQDFNGDGKSDLLWHNSVTGQDSIWLMNGTTQIGVANFGPYAGWTLVSGNQDFNGDGKSDLLWQNSSGEQSIWLMNGTSQIGAANFGPYANWTVVSANQDFNGDGKSDLLWHNSVTGQDSIWLMDGTTQIGVANLGPYANWAIKAGP